MALVEQKQRAEQQMHAFDQMFQNTPQEQFEQAGVKELLKMIHGWKAELQSKAHEVLRSMAKK